MALNIVQIPVLRDNYIYLVQEPASGQVAVVDPAEAEPVIAELESRGWTLNAILNTHHHPDHVGGNRALKQRYGCRIVGPKADEWRIPGIDETVDEGDTWSLGEQTAQVMMTPGHTRGHCVYWFADANALFCGDTLFALGCGRLFEGSPQQMWASLLKLRALPDETLIYCAHEYTQANARFALTIDGGNPQLQAMAKQVDEARRRQEPTVPSRLADEKQCNPFLRADADGLRQVLGMADVAPEQVFAEIRQRKDRF
jgi:hydroxyacylglutathione hydrolase